MQIIMGNKSAAEKVELRGMCPREIVDMLDAVALARGNTDRTEIWVEVMGEWAVKMAHLANVIVRVTRCNVEPADDDGATPELVAATRSRQTRYHGDPSK
jgi:anti-sigma-K factor RskA